MIENRVNFRKIPATLATATQFRARMRSDALSATEIIKADGLVVTMPGKTEASTTNICSHVISIIRPRKVGKTRGADLRCRFRRLSC